MVVHPLVFADISCNPGCSSNDKRYHTHTRKILPLSSANTCSDVSLRLSLSPPFLIKAELTVPKT